MGTITDDDAPPNARVSDASTDEGGTLEFAVTLSAPSGREVSIPVATRDGTARAADGDYVPLASTHVVFAPGATRQVLGGADPRRRCCREQRGRLGGPGSDAGGQRHRHYRRQPRPRRDPRHQQPAVKRVGRRGNRGRQRWCSRSASRRGPAAATSLCGTAPSAGTAAAGDDYDDRFEAATRELKIVAGSTSATVIVPTVNDRLDEDNETVELVLSSPVRRRDRRRHRVGGDHR